MEKKSKAYNEKIKTPMYRMVTKKLMEQKNIIIQYCQHLKKVMKLK